MSAARKKISQVIRFGTYCTLLVVWATALWLPAQVFPIKVDRQWGLVNAAGKMIASPRYDAIHTIDDEHSVVVLDGRYGLLSSSGHALIEPEYTFLRGYNAELFLINEGGDCASGECTGGKWGLVHLKNGARLEPHFNLIGEFDDNGYALVNVGGDCDYDDCRGGTWGMVDTLGRLRIPAEYLTVSIGNGREVYLKTANGWGMYNLVQEKMLIPPIYGELKRVGPNRVTMKTAGKYGVLTDNGDTLISPRYDGIKDALHGYLAYQENRKYGLMDSVGNHRTTARFDQVTVQEHGWVKVRDANMWGLVDLQDHEIIGPVLRQVGTLGPNHAAVQRGPLWGVVRKDGRFVVPDKYEHLEVVNDSLFLVEHRKYHKWLDAEGKVVKTYLFEEKADWVGNVARVRMRDGWGLINRRGTWVVPPRCDEIRIYKLVGKARIGQRWQYFYFDADGNPSQIKRLVLMKGEEEPEFDNSLTSQSVAGWFFSNSKAAFGLRNPKTNRLMLEPKYFRIELIPGTNFTAVFGDIEPGGERGWGLVDHTTGRVLHAPLFNKIYTQDLRNSNQARVTYASGRFALLRNTGRVINFDGAAYIGEFRGDVARINLGGYLQWADQPGIDTLARERINDLTRRQMGWRYQYCRGGKWGFIDREGELICPAQFQTALDFQNGLARVRQDDKWGLVNERFAVVVKPQYDFIENLMAEAGKVLFTVGMMQPRYGFIDQTGETAIEPRFDEVGEFREGKVRIRSGNVWGYADTTGKVIIRPQFREAGDFYEGRARVRNDRYWGFIDEMGNPLTPEKFLRAGDFHEGHAWVQSGKFFGYLGLLGDMEISAEYTKARDFSEGLAAVKRKGGYGLINGRGRWAVPPRFYRINAFHDSLAVVQENAQYGLVNPHGEFVVRPIFKELGDFSDGLAVVRQNLQYGYLDREGKLQIPCQFANAGPFSCGRAAVFINGQWGFIDTTGTVRVQNRFSRVRGYREERAGIRVQGKWGFIDPNGKVAVPTIYDRVGDFGNGRAPVYLEKQGWGFVNPDGTLVVPCIYEEVRPFGNGLAAVQQNGKWGLINPFGAPVTLLKYDAIQPYRSGLAAVLLKRQVGVVDAAGNALLPPTYDTVRRIGTRIQVEANDKIGYLDPAGEWIWQPSK